MVDTELHTEVNGFTRNQSPYRLIHGNTTEISNMYKEAMSRPLSLSHDIYSYVQPHVHSWSNIYGKNYLQWFGSRAQLVIREPELCKQILNNKGGAYPKIPPQDYVKKLLGYGLVTAEAETWTKLRKISDHAFHGESLKVSCYYQLLEILANNTVVDSCDNFFGIGTSSLGLITVLLHLPV